jgi:hypothetical protein
LIGGKHGEIFGYDGVAKVFSEGFCSVLSCTDIERDECADVAKKGMLDFFFELTKGIDWMP